MTHSDDRVSALLQRMNEKADAVWNVDNGSDYVAGRCTTSVVDKTFSLAWGTKSATVELSLGDDVFLRSQVTADDVGAWENTRAIVRRIVTPRPTVQTPERPTRSRLSVAWMTVGPIALGVAVLVGAAFTQPDPGAAPLRLPVILDTTAIAGLELAPPALAPPDATPVIHNAPARRHMVRRKPKRTIIKPVNAAFLVPTTIEPTAGQQPTLAPVAKETSAQRGTLSPSKAKSTDGPPGHGVVTVYVRAHAFAQDDHHVISAAEPTVIAPIEAARFMTTSYPIVRATPVATKAPRHKRFPF